MKKQVRNQSMFSVINVFSTILVKIFGTKWSNPVKLDRKKKAWCFLTAIGKV